MKAFGISLLLCLLQLQSGNLLAQDSSTYKMEILRAAWVGPSDKSYVVMVFKITPTVANFKLVLSMKFTYDAGQGEQVLTEHSKIIRMAVYDEHVRDKDRKVYNFVQDKVDLNSGNPVMLLRVDLRSLPDRSLDHLRVKYGLWEGKDDEVRHEQWFDFPVENLTHVPSAFDQ